MHSIIEKRLISCLMQVIVDEISMVKSDMLYQLDFRLQEIMQNQKPFGGISLFVFGDLMQLKPVMGNFIFEKPHQKDYEMLHRCNPRWKMFKCIILEKNHRQGKDKGYAELLNRLRIGEETEEDIETLNSRIRREKHEDIQSADLFIGAKRKDCYKINQHHIFKKIEGEVIKITSINYQQNQKEFKPRINEKDETIGNTKFQYRLLLKRGAKVMIIHNIETIDGLTNGQFGILKEVTYKEDEKTVDKLIIQLRNSRAGEMNRQRHPLLASRYPGCVIIDRVSFQYSICNSSGDVGSTATLIQFPVSLAHAVTAHKVQGQSIQHPLTVVMDINSTFEPAQSYVMLSRIQRLEQLYILNALQPAKLKISRIALKELERLQSISENENPSLWKKENKNSLKVAMLNCAGLKPHVDDIKADYYLLHSDILFLVETSLFGNEEVQIDAYEAYFHNISRGRGMAAFSRTNGFTFLQEIKYIGIHIIKYRKDDVCFLSVYRSSNGNVGLLVESLLKLLKEESCALIMGDFNICNEKKPTNVVKTSLTKNGFSLIIKHSTHICGGHIDHAYWRDSDVLWKEPIIQRHGAYYSDHDALCVTLERKDI